MKLNLGCGDNKLPGWSNHDADVDISKRLPWPDDSADFVFCEHCVEHIDYYAAIDFFKECRRVLKADGTLRITTPSIEKIMTCNDQAYYDFTTKFHDKGATVRGAMHGILYCHGHKTAWTDALLKATLFFAGFDLTTKCAPHVSLHPELKNVEGHHRVIGEAFNDIESIVYEASGGKPSTSSLPGTAPGKVAIVVGGAEEALSDCQRAELWCHSLGVIPEVFVANDMIASFPGKPDRFVTLHPDKLPMWLHARQAKGLPEVKEIWAHRRYKNIVTNTTDDWGGSSGLFMVKIARSLGFDRILLCGIPMDPHANHFVRHQRWNACAAFRRSWERRKLEIAPYVRSMSGGWTDQLLGKPDAAWLSREASKAA